MTYWYGFSICCLLLLVLENPFNNYYLNNANYTNSTNITLMTDIVNLNQTCSVCNIINDHISVPCFSNSLFKNYFIENMTCNIYYEVCITVPCHTLNNNTTNTITDCYDCIDVYFKGNQIRVSRQTYLTCISIILIYFLMPCRKLDNSKDEINDNGNDNGNDNDNNNCDNGNTSTEEEERHTI